MNNLYKFDNQYVRPYKSINIHKKFLKLSDKASILRLGFYLIRYTYIFNSPIDYIICSRWVWRQLMDTLAKEPRIPNLTEVDREYSDKTRR